MKRLLACLVMLLMLFSFAVAEINNDIRFGVKQYRIGHF